MKKAFLTFIAVGFGFSVAFAQTTPTQENQQEVQVQTEQSVANQAEQDKRQVEMTKLPQEAQDAFNNGQYSDMQVIAIYEKTSDPKKENLLKRSNKRVL